MLGKEKPIFMAHPHAKNSDYLTTSVPPSQMKDDELARWILREGWLRRCRNISISLIMPARGL
jgi:hypothetical protein